MSQTPNASKQYLKNAVMTASSEQLHLMLLDGAIRFALHGLEAIKADNIEEMFNALERAQRIVLELSNGLRREANPELVDRMTALFAFIYRRLVDANMQRETPPVEDALRILRHQRETWALLIEKIKKDVPIATESTSPTAGESGLADGGSRFVAEG
jgi:flagellar protein FliS